jgi:hypothetical protein
VWAMMAPPSPLSQRGLALSTVIASASEAIHSPA